MNDEAVYLVDQAETVEIQSATWTQQENVGRPGVIVPKGQDENGGKVEEGRLYAQYVRSSF